MMRKTGCGIKSTYKIWVDGIKNRADDNVKNNLDRLEDAISKMKEQLFLVEEMYRKIRIKCMDTLYCYSCGAEIKRDKKDIPECYCNDCIPEVGND